MNTYDRFKVNSDISSDQLLVKSVSCYEKDATTKTKAEFYSSLLVSLGYSKKMNQPLGWLIEDKNVAKKSVVSQVIFASNSLICLADNLSDTLMLEKVFISGANLKRFSEIKLVTYTQQAIDISREHTEELASYGLTEVKLVSLETRFATFEKARADHKLLVDEKAKNKKKFNQTKKEINAFLNEKLDLRIENLRTNHPEFVNQYFSVRKASKLILHSYDLLGYISDVATKKSISYGSVSIEELDLKADITQTGPLGLRPFHRANTV